MKIKILFLFLALLTAHSSKLIAQSSQSIIRGTILNKNDGQPLAYATVYVDELKSGTTTDINGFFQISNVAAGDYNLKISLVGFVNVEAKITVAASSIFNKSFFLTEDDKTLQTVEISGKKELRRLTPLVSQVTISPQQIKNLPSVGGEPDIAQYITTLPGVVSSGDQGGQIYIRGGSPVENKILLDGMPIYNPFHSIGFFSVFETEAVRSVDVFTGGFNAQYGGRISSVIDVKMREGNKSNYSGLASVSPFQAKAVLEGPLLKLREDGNTAISFLVTAKHSLLPQTSQNLYKYALKDSATSLPFGYDDFYGKVSLVAKGGSKLNIFGFNFSDGVNYPNVATLSWKNNGFGSNFTLVPATLNMIIDGAITYSNYNLSLKEAAPDPRTNALSNFTAKLDFTVFGNNGELKYGAEYNAIGTDLAFKNPLGFSFLQSNNTNELSGYVKYLYHKGRLVIEPGLRVQSYTALGETTFEPRIAFKLNASDNFRLKFSGGLYSQNLISTVNSNDIVNLFVGYLTGPEESFNKPGTNQAVDTRLQKSSQIVGGFEADLNPNLSLNVEGYYKNYNQLIDINSSKSKNTEANYIAETGEAYGTEFSLTYKYARWDINTNYTLSYVNRFDGTQTYPTNFDRRNSINVVLNYAAGAHNEWNFSARFNYGSGFPFTLTQGFYTNYTLSNGVNTDVLRGNPSQGIIYSSTKNEGRLPDFHRLDVSVRRNFKFSKSSGLDIVASVTNAYNRNNIFYFDRVSYKRVDQLPILPALSATFRF